MITTHPNSNGSITVAEGSEVVLMCNATGNGTLEYEWMRESKQLPNTAVITDEGQTLTIDNIAFSDSGQYYCEVDNGGNSVSSRRVQVTVKRESLYTVPLIYNFTFTRIAPRSFWRVKFLSLPWKNFFPREESWHLAWHFTTRVLAFPRHVSHFHKTWIST